MRKGFTLLELIVVMIIIGILATLGFSQYSTMIEKSRGAEARGVIGTIRTAVIGLNLEARATDNTNSGIGTAVGLIPNTCASSESGKYFFSYSITTSVNPIVITAGRCSGGGKSPAAPAGSANTLTLTTNLTTGAESWGGSGGVY